MTLDQIEKEFTTCPDCYVYNEIGHINELDRATRKLLEKAHGTKELYVVFCPRCENTVIVRSK